MRLLSPVAVFFVSFGPAAFAGGPALVAFPPDAGLVDVTKPPYNAKGDGKADDTAALQAALADCAGKRTPVYLPAGTYLVSDALRWPNEDRKGQHVWGFCHLQGQGPGRTVIRLKDNTFTGAPKRPRDARPVITSGPHGSADWFHNYVRDLTIDTGSGNPAAIGLRFFSNNTGAVRDVHVVSGDGQGVTGLDLSFNDMNGPLLVKGVTIKGFAVGVRAGHVVNSQTLEHVTLQDQTEAGVLNDGQALSVRGLTSDGRAPAIRNNAGLLVVLDSTLTGPPDASAIVNRGHLYARGIKTAGYGIAIAGARNSVTGPTVTEFSSDDPTSLTPGAKPPAPLEIRETPEPPQDDPKTWASVVAFGADPTGRKDASAAIQKAIDSGAATVYFPTGAYTLSTALVLRGPCRRLVGFNSNVDYNKRVKGGALRVEAGESDTVFVEGFNPLGSGLVHASNRTLVIRDCDLRAYAGTGKGDVYFENVATEPVKLDHQHAWARQLNVENKGTHVSNVGGTLWVLGYKTERGGTLVDTSAGGVSQVDGGFSYTTEAGKLAPMFVTTDAALAATFGEVCFNGDPFAVLLTENRARDTASLPRTDRRWRGVFARLVSPPPARP